jgi:hypothetical protein
MANFLILTNALAYLTAALYTTIKSFMVHTSLLAPQSVNVIKLFLFAKGGGMK